MVEMLRHSQTKERANRKLKLRPKPARLSSTLPRWAGGWDSPALLDHLKAYADGREARAGIGQWMTFDNSRRPHQAMNNQTPMAVWRDGMDEIEAAARAVDMPLCLDNANALPTYPQQKQQQKAA